MDYFGIDHLIVGAFLLITLVVGLWAGRGIKDIREYVVANKRFGTGALTMTLIATYIGGWHLVGFPGDVFASGLTHLIPEVVCGVIVCLLFIAWFIAPQMKYFKDCLTMGDLMHRFYGEYGQMLTGCLGLIYNTTALSIQMLFLGYVCELLGIRSDWGLSLAVLVLTIYTAQGGIRSVTITDILQFMAIIAAVPLLAHLVTYQAGGIRALLSSVPQEKLQLLNFGQAKAGAFSASYYTFPILTLWFLFPGFPLSFPFIQRMLMAKHTRQVVNMYYISMAFLVVFFLLLTLIGLATLVVYPQIDSKDVLSHIITHLPGGPKGLALTALLAIIMSTTDSFLHAAGVSFTHDLLKPLLAKRGIAINELRGIRYTIFVIGCLAIVVALGVRDISKIAMYGMDLAALLFTIPLIAGIMGLKTDTRSFVTALLTTLTAFTLTKLYLGEDVVIPICILVNALSFFGAHYRHNKGFAVVNRAAEQQETYVWQPTWKASRARLAHVLTIPKKLLRYSQDKVAKYGANPTLFALFVSFNYMVPFFMHSYADPAYYSWLLAFRGIGALLCVGLLLKPLWPARLVPYFPTYYHLSLLYCLPFVTTFLFLLEGSSMEWLINVSLAIMLLIVLVDWLTFVVLSLAGVLLGIAAYKLLLGSVVTPDNDTMYTLVYACFFATLIGLLFARRKQARFDTVATDNKRLDTIYQETMDELLASLKEKVNLVMAFRKSGAPNLNNLTSLSKEIGKALVGSNVPQSVINQHDQLTKQLTSMAVQLDRLDHRATGYLRLEVATMALADLLGELQEKLQAQGLAEGIQFYKATQHQEVQCDLGRVKTLLANGISFLRRSREEEAPILVGIEDTQLGYPLPSVKKDYIKKIAALRFAITTAQELPQVAPYYPAQLNDANTPMPEGMQDLLLATNRRIVSAHYGHEKIAMQASNITLLYVLPVQLREVRPKDMDIAQMELGAKLVRADDTYPGAQEQEKAFLAAVQQRTQADIAAVKTVLEMIKWYHGPVKRKSGEPFYLHPLAVAHIVLDYNQDEATILGALLHDTVEDTPMLLENVEIMFGQEVAGIVDGVTHLESHKESFYKVKLSSQENILMLLEVADQRALYVKLADRMHNMRTIQAKPYKSQRRTSEETLQFFVPLAEKLGLQAAAAELQELCRAVLHSPDR